MFRCCVELINHLCYWDARQKSRNFWLGLKLKEKNERENVLSGVDHVVFFKIKEGICSAVYSPFFDTSVYNAYYLPLIYSLFLSSFPFSISISHIPMMHNLLWNKVHRKVIVLYCYEIHLSFSSLWLPIWCRYSKVAYMYDDYPLSTCDRQSTTVL